MTTFELLSQYSFVEKIQLILNWIYDRVLGKRKGLYELRELIKDTNPAHVRFRRQGRNNVITITGDEHIGDATVVVRRMSSDVPVFRQVFVSREYQVVIDEVLKKNEKDDIRYIIDAGANIGFTTLYLAKCFPKASIVSIEPEESNYRMMIENFRLNNLDRVTPIKKALWSKSMDLEVDRTNEREEWAFTMKPSSDSNDESVRGITVKELCAEHHIPQIDIFKIDIEGAEQHLFANETVAGTFLPVTRYVAMEVHERFNVSAHILDMLKKFHFSYFTSGELVIAVNDALQKSDV